MAKNMSGLRVSFDNAPASVLKTLFGDAKDKKVIIQAIADIGSQPLDKAGTVNPAVHTKEIFHYINTDQNGEWLLNGEGEVHIGMQNLQRQLTALVDTGQLIRTGERTGRFTLAAGVTPEAEDEDEE